MFSIAVRKPQVGHLGLLDEIVLLGHVHRDSDQLHLRGVGIHHLRTGPHPHPLAVRMAHAEYLVDVIDFACDDPVGELEKIRVFGMDDVGDIAERQHRVAGLVSEHVVHRARPIHLAAHHVPVPQAAAPADQGQVDPLMRLQINPVGRLGARSLAEIGVKDDDQDAGGQNEERDVEGDALPPLGKNRILRNQCRRCPIAVAGQAERGEPVAALYSYIHDAGSLAEQEQRLATGDDLVQ